MFQSHHYTIQTKQLTIDQNITILFMKLLFLVNTLMEITFITDSYTIPTIIGNKWTLSLHSLPNDKI